MKPHEENFKNLIEYPQPLPVPKASPACYSGAAELKRYVFPWNAGAHYVDDARKGSPVGNTWAPSPLALGVLRQHRLKD